MPILMSVRPLATFPHTRTHVESNRAGPGRAHVARTHTNAVRFRGLLDLLHFFDFLFKFLFKILLRFSGRVGPLQRESDLHAVTTRARSQILPGCYKLKDLHRVINTLISSASFTWNKYLFALFLPQRISYIYSAFGIWSFLNTVFTSGQRTSIWAET